jgi:hypothetical protein
VNLHVTNDSYGLYPVEIAKRIKSSPDSENNIIVNLYPVSEFKDSLITYIPEKISAYKKYISGLSKVDKVIFHPYNVTAYRFLQELLKKFPGVKVYWMCWSYELYNLPHLTQTLYDVFSTKYLKRQWYSSKNIKRTLRNYYDKTLIAASVKKDYESEMKHAHSLVHYFCSPFYSDYLFLEKVSPGNKIKYLSIAYLSLDKIIPDLSNFRSRGNRIMIGHSASPDGNHYEALARISSINNELPILLPLSYGDKHYGNIIKKEARSMFKNVEILETKMERTAYYEKLTEAGWAVFNTRVQQGVGNIIALIWMGVKVFLDNNTSTYKDFTSWGIHVYSIQEHLNEFELSNKLSFEQVENNRKKILEKFNEETINEGWKFFLRS